MANHNDWHARKRRGHPADCRDPAGSRPQAAAKHECVEPGEVRASQLVIGGSHDLAFDRTWRVAGSRESDSQPVVRYSEAD